MAQFPTTVPTFTTKSNGNTIDASHINDVQTEVAAIGDGYLNGTARLNAGASTLATLSVTGGSTFANVNVTGTLTNNVIAVRAFSTAVIGLANNTDTALSFTSQRFMSTTGLHSTASNPSRLIPVSSGYYSIGGNVLWGSFSSGGTRLLQIRVDGSSVIAADRTDALNSTAARQSQQVHTVYHFASTTQYVELVALQNSGSTGSIDPLADQSAEFWMFRLI